MCFIGLFFIAVLGTEARGATSELIQNGSFENDLANWNQALSFFPYANSAKAHSGSRYGYFGVASDGVTALNNASGSIDQSISIASNASSATLTFWLWVASDEGTTSVFDTLSVELINSLGTVILLGFYSNQNKSGPFNSPTPAYQQKSFSLNSYIGQNIRVRFRGTTNGSNATIFRLDDVSVSVTTPDPVPPTVTTNAATNVTKTSARANGTINPNGNSTDVYFQFGPTTSYGQTTSSANIGGATSNIPVFSDWTGLTPNTTYHYRVVASNSGGLRAGVDASFTTPPDPPVLSQVSPPSIPALVGDQEITLTGSNFQPGAHLIFFPATGNPIQSTASKLIRDSASQIRYQINNAGDVGTWQVKVVNPNGDTSSAVSFTISAAIVQTNNATLIAAQSAQLNGFYDFRGLTGTVYFEYGTTTNYGTNTPAGASTATSQNISYPASGLVPNTAYHYRFVGTSGGIVTHGEDKIFTTSIAGTPRAQTSSATSVTSTSAQLNGLITPQGHSTVIYFQYGLTPAYDSTTPDGIIGTTAQNVGYIISGLTPNTTYHFRLVGVSGGAFGLGDDMTFTTPSASYTLTVICGDVYLNQLATFTGHTSPTSAESQITSWSWQFSDGENLSGQTVHPKFTAGNSGSVTLRATDNSGNTTSTLFQFVIKGNGSPLPQNTSTSRDPVNLATGNFIADARDLVIPGRGLPFVFERFYNSKSFDPSDSAATPPVLAWGWSHTFETHVKPALADGTRTVVFGDGHVERYSLAGGAHVAESGVRNVFAANADGTFTLTSKNQVKHTFASDAQNGRLTSIADRNGNVIAVTYDDGNRRIDFITDTVGRKIQFQYDSAGRLSALVDAIGGTVQYSVDSSNDLHSVTNLRGYAVTFAYDSLHQLLTGTDARGHAFVQNTYDATTRTVTKQFDADLNETDFEYHFDATPAAYTIVTRKATGGDEVTYHYHDAKLRLVKRTDGRGTSYYETFEYDDTTSDRLAYVDKNENRYEFQYDGMSNVTQVKNPDGGITATTYNTFNDPVFRTNAKGVKAFWEYDAKGNQSAYTFPYDAANPSRYRRTQTVNAYGQIESYTDANGNKTTFYYDTQGNNWKTLDAAGNTTQREFDGVGRKTSDTDGRSNKTSYTLDANSNVTVTTFPDATTIKQTFDENDNRTSIEDQLHHTTSFAYDNQDRLFKTTDAAGNATIIGFDQLGNKVSVQQPGQGSGPVTITMGYDLAENQTSETDQLGNARTFTRDNNGNLLGDQDADGIKVTYTYDSMNRRTKVIDAANKEAVTTYDLLGQVSQVKDALGNITAYSYNDAGQLAGTTDAAANTFTLGYDFEGNQTSASRGTKTRSATYTSMNRLDIVTDENGRTERSTWDAAGNLATFTNGEGEQLTYGYDTLNRRTSISFPAGTGTTFTYFDDGRLKSMTDALGTTNWTYTALGQVASATDPFGQALAFGYDPNGNRSSIVYPGSKTVSYTFDKVNRLASMTDWLGRVTSRDYTSAGRASAVHFPNGVNTLIGYDSLGRENDIAHKKGTATPFVHFGYGFDDASNITSTAVGHPLTPLALTKSNVYTYDAANQIATIDGAATTHDRKGNFLTGKLSASSSSDSLTFDYQNRLTRAVIGGITTASRYDGQGHRLEITQGSTTKRFVVDGTGTLAQILAETDASGTVTAYYLYFGGLAARVLPNGTASYYHTDRNGSVAALTDGSGSVTDLYQYDPFGVSLGASGSSQNPFRYLGGFGVYDNGDGTLFARARHYHPDLGRFLSRDALLGNNKDGQSLNRYVYALNSPVRFVDANGFSARDTLQLSPYQYWKDPVFWKAFGQELAVNGVSGLIAIDAILGVATFGEALLAEPGLIAWRASLAGNEVAEIAETKLPTAESGVWRMSSVARGSAIEEALGANLPRNFPTIDRFSPNGVVTSIKSIDLGAASYQNATNLTRLVNGYVDKVAAFNGRTWAGVTIENAQITARQLQIAVPEAGTAAQQAALTAAAQRAQSLGVQLIITPFR